MNKLKTIIAAALCSVFLLSAGCMGDQKTYSVYNGNTDWLKNVTAQKNETCVYGVTYEQKEGANLTFTPSAESEVKTTLKKQTENGAELFVLTVETVIKGEYSYQEKGETKTQSVNDSTTTVCYFASSSERFLPVLSTTFNDTIYPHADNDGGYTFLRMAYSDETTYNKKDNKVTVTVTATDGVENNNISSGSRTYDGYNQTYFDNAQTLLTVRLPDYEEGFYATYRSLSPLDGKINTLKLEVDSTKPADELKLPYCSVNGVLRGENPFNVFKVNFSLSGTFAGAARIFYIDSDAANGKKLIKFSQVLAKDLGNLVFTLKEYNLR